MAARAARTRLRASPALLLALAAALATAAVWRTAQPPRALLVGAAASRPPPRATGPRPWAGATARRASAEAKAEGDRLGLDPLFVETVVESRRQRGTLEKELVDVASLTPKELATKSRELSGLVEVCLTT